MNGYKSEQVQQKLEEIRKQMKELEEGPDNELKISELMTELSIYQKYRNKLSKSLGRNS